MVSITEPRDWARCFYCDQYRSSCICQKVSLPEIVRFKDHMTRVKINGKVLSEMTFQEAYPEVIRLLIEGRFPTIK